MKKPLLALFIIQLVAIDFPLFGQRTIRSDYYFRNWGIENGLSQGSVTCIAQTPDGYIWLGTQEALSRLDGIRVKNFTSRNTPSLKTSWVQSLTLSQEQRLIVGTWRGGIYEWIDGEFRLMYRENRPELAQAIIYALACSADGTIWAGTSNGLFSVQNGSIRAYGKKEGLPPLTIRSLLVDHEDTLWIGSEDQGLWRHKNQTFSRYSTENGLSSDRIWALARHKDRGIWIGCAHTLTHFDGKGFQSFPVPVSKGPNMITGIVHASDGQVWLTLVNEGVWRFDGTSYSSVAERDGLASNLALSIFEDREKNIWVGTSGSGSSQLVRNLIRVVSRDEGLPAKEVWTVMESKDGSLWIGTHGGGLARLLNGEMTRYSLRDGLSSMQITAIHQSPLDDSIWVGSEDNGFMKIDTGGITPFHLGPSIAENTIYAISEQDDGQMLIGSAAGITFWKDGKVQSRLTTEDGLTHNAVREFAKGRGPNEFWVSTDIGLNLIQNGQIVSSWSESQGLAEDALNGLYLDRENNLWISTYGNGIIHYQSGRFTSITSANGLHNDVVYDIVEDEKEWFWMSSNRGVFAVRKAELLEYVSGKVNHISSFHLGIGDGLRSLECNGGRQPAVWMTRSGLACFATIDGVAILDTKQFNTDESAPPVVFEEVRVNNRSMPLSAAISIPPGKRNFDIEYTSPYFSAPEKIRYQYRLVPFEENWQDCKGIRMAHYTNIPPGEYRFELKSSNRFGILGNDVEPLTLEFRPYFYETLLFHILVALLLIGLILLYLQQRTQHLKKSKKALEEAVTQRTMELKAAYDQMEKLSLTDALTSLYNRRYFHNIIDREISHVIRKFKSPPPQAVSFVMGFLMIDIDHFKRINDRHGHLCGDQLLQRISRRFIETLRASDLIVRWGGEEFLILSKETDFEGARLLSQRLLSAINREAFQINDMTIKATISIGFCPFPMLPRNPRIFSWEDTVSLADQALYHAKHSGRNCAVGIRMNAELLNQDNANRIREDLAQALSQNLIDLVTDRS